MSRRRNASDLTAAILGSSVPSERHRMTLATLDAQIAMVDHLLAGLPTTREDDEATLSEILASLGWRHEPGHPNAPGRVVFDASGERVGQCTAADTFALLRDRGLLPAVSL